AIDMDAIGTAIRRFHAQAQKEQARTGDTLAGFRDLAPPQVVQAVSPSVGDGRDHGLRVPPPPPPRMPTLGPDDSWRATASKLRRVLGVEPIRPKLRLLGTTGE